jgi:hypothetical protein
VKLATLFLVTSLFSFPLLAADWEYKVVFLPGTVSAAKVVKEEPGGYYDQTKTDILNKLAAKGWVLVAVTGASGADHAAYLKREVTSK